MTKILDITEYLSRGKQPKYASYSSLPVINQRAIRWFGIQSEYLNMSILPNSPFRLIS